MAPSRKRGARPRGFAHDAREMIDDTRERLEESRDRAEKSIKEHPFTSLAIAAGIGALVGIGTSMLMRPRSRSFLDRVRDFY